MPAKTIYLYLNIHIDLREVNGEVKIVFSLHVGK